MSVIDRRAAYGAVRDQWQGLGVPVYGQDDCVFWACAVFAALTGRNAAAELGLPDWQDQRSAVAAIRRVTGGRTLGDALDEAAVRLGLRRVFKLMAQTGDLALLHFTAEFQDGRRETLLAPGIIDTGRHGAALTRLRGLPGLVSVPMAGVVRAWRL